MSIVQTGLIFAGISTIAIGIFHFPKIWNLAFTKLNTDINSKWNNEIANVSLLTRKLINTVLLALGIVLIIIGLTTLFFVKESSDLSVIRFWFFSLCLIFWAWRLGWQVIYFPIKKLNPSKQLLIFHIFLIVTFLVIVLVYLAALLEMVN